MNTLTRTTSSLLTIVIMLAWLFGIGTTSSIAASISRATVQSQSSKQVSYNGISFTYDNSLASAVTASVVPEDKGGPNVPCWSTHPDETLFEFKDFAHSTSEMMPARIYVFPFSSNYRCLNPSETIDFWGREVDDLRNLLGRRPKLTEPQGAEGPGGTLLPYLPPINAARLLVGKEQYLNFRNGSGVRYLVHITQQPIAPSHADTLYTYQGMTSDGRYYVAAQFPAFLATPPNLSFPQGSQQDLDNYYVQLRRVVDQTSNADFLPDLSSLDTLVNSLTINSSAVVLPSATSPTSPHMPRTGTPANIGFLSTSDLPAIALAAVVMTLAGLAIRVRRTIVG